LHTKLPDASADVSNPSPKGNVIILCAERKDHHSSCHPERSAAESKDLGISFVFAAKSVPGSFGSLPKIYDFLRSLRMTTAFAAVMLYVLTKADNYNFAL